MCVIFFDEPDQFQFSEFDFELIEYLESMGGHAAVLFSF